MVDFPQGVTNTTPTFLVGGDEVAQVPAKTPVGPTGRTLLDTDTPTEARQALGLGDSATKNVGTTTGTVAAGDDARFTDARTPTSHTHTAANISDSTAAGRTLLTDTDAAAQRASLGLGTAATAATSDFATATQGTKADTAIQADDLGTAATADIGTTAGTVAAGNDARFTDARTPVAHTHAMSEITDISTVGKDIIDSTTKADARAALDLGDSATRSVGTTPGTVADGGDARFSDARTPTAHVHAAIGISDSTEAGRALLTDTDASAQRESLGLGTAATKNVGSVTGTVCAGDDPRLTGASDHNNLLSLQGGQTNEYYHLTAAEHTAITGSKLLTAFNRTGSTIAGHRAVVYDVATDSLILATPATHTDAIIGITTGAIADGAVGTAVIEGPIVEGSWTWPVHAQIYLLDNGVLSSSIPLVGDIRPLGRTITSTKLHVAQALCSIHR